MEKIPMSGIQSKLLDIKKKEKWLTTRKKWIKYQEMTDEEINKQGT